MSLTSENPSLKAEIKEWLQNSPPRILTPHLRKHLSKKSNHWLIIIFGLLFGGFGCALCAVFLPWQILNEYSLNNAPPRLVEGIVTKVEETNSSINEVRVWKNEVTFTENSDQFVSVGYTTGKSFSENQTVTVRVHPNNPNLHCPQNMRMSKGSLASSFVLLFPIFGLLVMVTPWFAKRNRIYLLENGIVANARVTAFEATRVEVNDAVVHKVTLEILNTAEQIVTKKHDPDEVSQLHEAYSNRETIRIIYDRKKPKKFIIV